jgi:hypothetical protein
MRPPSFWLITIMALAGAHLIQRPSFSRLVLTCWLPPWCSCVRSG